MMLENCDPRIEDYLDSILDGRIVASKEIIALCTHVKDCFENEDIYVDSEQLTNYLKLVKYLPFSEPFPWQICAIGLHDCTYWRKDNTPRWKEMLVEMGRGNGKDGTISWEAMALTSPYNGIHQYNVDICANNEDQALQPVIDLSETFDTSKYSKTLKKFYHWTKETVQSIKTKSKIVGRTNNAKGKDGLRSGIVIYNEIHQYQDYKNYNVFTTGLGKKSHPRISYYTTQGEVREGPLDDLLKDAEDILFGGLPDNGFLPFIYKLDSIEEVHDEKMWGKANPSLPYLPNLLLEMRDEYHKWLKNPGTISSFIIKRMNLIINSDDIAVTDYENIKSTNKNLPDLTGWECTIGIDYSKISDFVSVNTHFRDGDVRYDINHTWVCKDSKDLPRIKAPLEEWERLGLVTFVNGPEINPQVIMDYIDTLIQKYVVKMLAIDDFRYALLAKYLALRGFSRENHNLKLVRPSDIMRVFPVIDSCFLNHHFVWGDNPCLRWATNNTKAVRHGRDIDQDIGNFVYGKIEAKSRKTDPFMALVASMTVEDSLSFVQSTGTVDFGVFVF